MGQSLVYLWPVNERLHENNASNNHYITQINHTVFPKENKLRHLHKYYTFILLYPYVKIIVEKNQYK